MKSKFVGKNLTFFPQHKEYIELLLHNEKYSIAVPGISAHNIIIGTPYVDLGGKSTIRNLSKPHEYCELEYHRRGWSQASYFRVDGEIYQGKELVYKIEARWNENATLINMKTGEREIIWTKNPYPEKWQSMYGMSHFTLQLNYFPNFLRNKVAPTDTRWRPDQRALENGDLKLAGAEKNRLEEKQRAIRRYDEKLGVEHKPVYFEQWMNPDDDSLTYYRYNGQYFEKDRKDQTWSRLPDLYSDKRPPEVADFSKKH